MKQEAYRRRLHQERTRKVICIVCRRAIDPRRPEAHRNCAALALVRGPKPKEGAA